MPDLGQILGPGLRYLLRSRYRPKHECHAIEARFHVALVAVQGGASAPPTSERPELHPARVQGPRKLKHQIRYETAIDECRTVAAGEGRPTTWLTTVNMEILLDDSLSHCH